MTKEKTKDSKEVISQSEKSKTSKKVKLKTSKEVKSKTSKESKIIEELTDELKVSKDKYLRLYSEFENFKRRTAKEKLEMVTSANERLICSLLSILDDFERANKLINKDTDVKAIKEGMNLVYNKLKNVLEQKGAKKMDLEEGSDFNTDFHEAITQIPTPKDNLKGKIIDVIENGYTLGNKVIRFAKVVTGL